MAFSFPKFDFFNRLDARARIFFLLMIVVGLGLIIYFAVRFLSSSSTTGASRVASAPQGLQSVPGSQLTPEYYRALTQANELAAKQAQMTGTSAIPTLINVGGQTTTPSAQCNIICPDNAANVKPTLDEWVRQGKISPEVASLLQQLADKNVSVDEYAAQLAQLVKEGKLTPEQARQLLEQYKRQRGDALLQESAKVMDGLIKSGQLPLDVANQLLAAQKSGASPTDYAAQLQDLVKQGKISPATAQQLLAQYTQQRAREAAAASAAALGQMVRAGEITPEVQKGLANLIEQSAPLDTYANALQQYVAAGKLTPATAAKLLAQYKAQKGASGPLGTVNELLQQAEAAAYGEINDLLKTGKISPEVALQLQDMLQKNISMEAQQAVVNQLVQQNKLTPDIAKLKIADYRAVKGLRDLSARLTELQGNNAAADTIANELKAAVQNGILTPEQAAQLMQEYQAMTATVSSGITTTAGTTDAAARFAELQQRVQNETATAQVSTAGTDFTAAQSAAQQANQAARDSRIQAMMAAMSNQAQQLIAAWNPPAMIHKAGTPDLTNKKMGTGGGEGEEGGGGSAKNKAAAKTVLIKAGTVLFAVLDTAVNSDYPDTPVMATIVDGQFKSAKLLGKLMTAKNVAGQLDKVSLNFTLMNLDDWPASRTVTAYAIDPDTARLVMASQVDYHYAKRFGAIMATSFLQGYASAITTSGGTTTTGIFGTSTQSAALSPQQKIAVGLGQMGQTLGSTTQNYVNIPPTVKVDSGVGLGILFMADVTS